MWALDDEHDRRFVDETKKTYVEKGANVYFVELEATQEVRLHRNETPLRLAEKRPQRDIAGSRAFLLDADRQYRLNSKGDFPYPELHLKIDNTDLTPEAVTSRIVERFGLPVANSGLTSLAADGQRENEPPRLKPVARTSANTWHKPRSSSAAQP